ncbi:transglycosylase SLT domain-containing protein [Flavobacteriaceae bacterium]|nr:transglycosylase SLT domain-containing protein [Flavobacteriaceae bacterium]
MISKKGITFIFLVLLNLSYSQSQISDETDLKIIIDTTVIELQDYKNAILFDNQWRAEFIDDSLYDSITKIVKEETFENIDFPELSSDTLRARLQELDSKTPFHISYNPALETLIKKRLKQRKVLYERLMKLSQYYFPLFEEIFDREGIPLEIKYLAVVESALRPAAKSRVGATGLWQFMFSTGKYYDLEVSSYVDERCDPVRSTIAAAKYLKSLYKSFDDWDLALAAYNSGPGNVTKAIRRSGGYKNYWNIRPFLPSETAGYLPAFLATMYLFEYAPQHGFDVSRHKMPLIKTDTVQIKNIISLKQVSEVIDIDLATLEFLNPSYKLGIIPVIKNKNYVLRLPIETIGAFVSNEEQIYAYAQTEFDRLEKPLPKFYKLDTKIRYKVQPGDYLGKIANKFRVKISQIKKWNNLRSDQLKAGSRLTIFTRNPQN